MIVTVDKNMTDKDKLAKLEKDNIKLDEISEVFIKDRSKENFVKIMEQLEKSTVYVPILEPVNNAQNNAQGTNDGRLTKDTVISPYLLRQNTGEQLQVLPIFSLRKHIIQHEMMRTMIALPFFSCVAMVMENKEKIEGIILNPFSQCVAISKPLIEVAHKRAQAGAPKTVKITEQMFHQLAKSRVAYELLPVFLYEKKKEGLKQLQDEMEKFLISLFTTIYPKEIKVPYTEDDFSLMTLNVTDNLQITRIDMPEKHIAKEQCLRIYVVWKKDTETLEYFTIEKGSDSDEVGRIYENRTHERIGSAPDNGTEIEMIMNIVS
ncbi:MAG: SseB family protein [Clostridiales bacterium]|nr:SseB family protein [Clostridiales bacterium]